MRRRRINQGRVSARLSRVAGGAHHARRRPERADFDGRNGGLRHRQHEARHERRAHHRHLDGANIEIAEEVGEENIYIFGLRAEEIREMQQKGTYDPRERYEKDASVHEVMDALASDRFCPNEHGLFRWIFDELVHHGDRYYHIADFPAYVETQALIDSEYLNEEIWWRKAILNVARIGKFSSDRTVTEYARDIWHIGQFETRNHVKTIPRATAPAKVKKEPTATPEALPVAEEKQVAD